MSQDSGLKLASDGVQPHAGASEPGGGPHHTQVSRRTTEPLGENQPGRKSRIID